MMNHIKLLFPKYHKSPILIPDLVVLSLCYLFEESKGKEGYGIKFNGKKEDLWIEIHHRGQIQFWSSKIYKDNKKNGLCKIWYNGQLILKGIYKENSKNGLWEFWSHHGQLLENMMYKDNKKDGLCRKWHQNGQLKYEGIYKEDKREGLCQSWYGNGSRDSKIIYKNDKIIETNYYH